jgi:hypothetical protein
VAAPKLVVTLTSVSPPGAPVDFNLLGDSSLTRAGGSGGWQIVDRPRRAATVEWLDYSPFELTLPLLLGGGIPQGSVEHACSRVEGWQKPAPGSITPPVLSISGPVPHADLKWVVKGLAWAEALRHPTAGYRVQQTVNVTLLEYVPAQISLSSVSPAKAAQTRQATSPSATASGRTYTVKSGDTLSGIAARVLGDYRRYTELASLNKIRDPNQIRVGQVLALPA